MPGFFFFPLKPHPKVNEYCTICCGESGIMYGWGYCGGKGSSDSNGDTSVQDKYQYEDSWNHSLTNMSDVEHEEGSDNG